MQPYPNKSLNSKHFILELPSGDEQGEDVANKDDHRNDVASVNIVPLDHLSNDDEIEVGKQIIFFLLQSCCLCSLNPLYSNFVNNN